MFILQQSVHPCLIAVVLAYCTVASAQNIHDKQFATQLKKETALATQIPAGYDTTHPQPHPPQPIPLTLEQTLSRALAFNQTIQDAILSYKQALLSYQETLFSFQINFGALNFDYQNTYGDAGGTLLLGNKIEKQFVNGLQAGLTNTLSNNIDENKYQLFDTSQFILHKQLYGWDQMRNKDLLQTARTTLATAKLTLRDIISDQMTEVSTNFRTALHEEESLYTMQGALQTSQSNIAKSKQQYATGFISQNDLDNIMLQEVNTQLNIESQTLRLNEGINRLKLKIGLSSADTIKLLPDLSQQPAIDTLVKKC